MARELRGGPVAAAITEDLIQRTKDLVDKGVTPTLAIIRVGERPDDLSYERGAIARAQKVGLALRRFLLPADCGQEDLLAAIDQVNRDDDLHGCLMFRPLPDQLDEKEACEALVSSKDVDCITAGSLAGVFANSGQGFAPCTAEAVVLTLEHYGFDLEGAEVCVLGRSLVIGKPVSVMLQAKNATVTMCHTRTRNLAAHTQSADIVVVATGHPKTLRADGVRAGQAIVDVGINWDEAAGKLVGDVAYDEVAPLVEAITPVPGGVGAVTTAVLAKHVVEAAERTLA